MILTILTILTILISLVFPLVIGDPNVVSLAVDTLLLMAAACSWNIFSGYTGYISLGQATYYGLGAYALAVACNDWHITDGNQPFLLVPLAGLVAGVFALPLGCLALRARGYTFIVITIALFFIFQLLASNLSGITGGSAGIFLPLPSWSPDFMNLLFYYVALALLLIVIAVSWWIRHSKYGLILLAIRDDEDRVFGLGVSTYWFKLGAYVVSAVFTGMVGATSIYFMGLVTPSSAFDTTLNINVIVASFLGGVGSVAGPIVGGLLFDPIQPYLTQQLGPAGSSIGQMIFGGFLLLIILLLPRGIVPELGKRWSMRMKTRSRSTLWEPLQPLPADIWADGLSQPGGSLAYQENGYREQHISIEQQPGHFAWTLPSRSVALSELPAMPSTVSVRLAQMAKAQRLKPLLLAGPAPLQEPTLRVSWRCPFCHKPFLLQGAICYCPRCGLTRPIDSEIH
jgi:ABC-type branched-subunit amino acid transport system permease subunit